ncbi:DUF6807 family protein [Verrucosispora sioxanthis]|uniref:Oxidoreductase n=2 Tax=Verrucosispora sioxanthis TaxID=2499994 RepID=A0A6M1KUK4_9ACTN|nr:DUF6807 family protein [Verrucosispora sioxanthis]NEE63316.1 oxidoreductase [Verrucosispora sioxanthis]NGM12426.1 oxidoreductase [Verrucosispora sioxanthis]
MGGRSTVSDLISLSLADHVVADYVWQLRLPLTASPRPFLHPVRTLTGAEVTELMPEDHPHHLGSVWRSPTWAGSTSEVVVPLFPAGARWTCATTALNFTRGWVRTTPSSIDHDLRWTGPERVDLLHERRTISAVAVSEVAWALDFSYEMTNVTALPLALASPATNGRPAAGYGGFFWRARRSGRRVEVLGPDRVGVRHLHGSRARWLALVGGGSDAPWSLVFVPDRGSQQADQWFVRHDDYAGVGSSLAWDRPLVLAPGAGIRRRIVTLVVDGRLRVAQVAGVLSAAEAILTGAGTG